jgi:membrane protease YdiL (CAAX protease family)
MKPLSRTASLTGFFLLTFVVTWSAWLASARWGGGQPLLFGLGGPVFLLGVFAPALVAIGLTAVQDGREGVARLLSRSGRWQVAARFYLFAVTYLVVIKLTAAVLHRAMLGVWPTFGDTPWPLMLGAILVSTWVQAGEEVGWRGYALPRLAASLGLGGAGVVSGIIWALWHLPLFFIPGTGSDGQSFPIYLLHVTAMSVAMAWLYWKAEGSLLLVMLMHAAVNNTKDIVPSGLADPPGVFSFAASRIAWITAALLWVGAIAMLTWMVRTEPQRAEREA